MANTVGTRNLPIECTCKLTIGGYEPLFHSTAQHGDIHELSAIEYEDLQYIYRMNKVALSYMADYDHLDVVKASINGNSYSLWNISPPSKGALIEDLNGSLPMTLKFEWYFKRLSFECKYFKKISKQNRFSITKSKAF